MAVYDWIVIATVILCFSINPNACDDSSDDDRRVREISKEEELRPEITKKNDRENVNISSAFFSSDFKSVTIRFSIHSQFSDGTTTCDEIFAHGTIGIFGKSKCRLRGTGNIHIELDPSANLEATQTLRFKGEAFTPNQGDFHLELIADFNSFIPDFHLEQRGILTNCPEDRAFVIVQSQVNVGYKDRLERPRWAQVGADKAVNAYLLKVQPDFILPLSGETFECYPKVYNLSFTAQNFLENQRTRYIPITKMCKFEPKIQISSPDLRNVFINEHLKLNSEFIASMCYNESATFKYQWTLTTDNKQEPKLVHDSRRFLYIPKNTLLPNTTYMAHVKVSIEFKGKTINLSDHVYIKTIRSPLIAYISGSDRTIGLDQTLHLDASKSFDPDQSDGREMFEWKCNNSEGICQSAKGGELPLTDSKELSLKMSNGNFSVGKRYIFSFKFVKGDRQAHAIIYVTVTDGIVPVLLLSSSNKGQFIKRDDRLILTATIKTASTKSIIGWYQWSCETENDGMLLLEGVLVEGTRYVGQLKDKSIQKTNLAFKRNVLEFGMQYTCYLEVYSQNRTTKSSITRTVENAPKNMHIAVTPIAGTAFETKFVIQIYGNDDKARRTYYQFGYQHQNGVKTVLSSKRESTTFITVLPKLETGSMVFCYVKDDESSTVILKAGIRVAENKQIQKALNLLNRQKDEAVSSDNFEQIILSLQQIASLNSEIHNSNTTNDSMVKPNELVSELISASNKDNIVDKDLFLGALKAVTKSFAKMLDQTAKAKLLLKLRDFSEIWNRGGSHKQERSIGDDEIETDDESYYAVTDEEVIEVLVLLEELVNSTMPSSEERSNALSISSNIINAICKRMVWLESTQSYLSNIANLTVHKNNHVIYDNQSSNYVAVKSEFYNKYDVWDCNGDEICDGFCLSSIVFDSKRFLHELISKQVTSVFTFGVHNPVSGQRFDDEGDETVFVITLPMLMYSNITKLYRPNTWDDWYPHDCRSSIIRMSDHWFIEAHCSSLGMPVCGLARDDSENMERRTTVATATAKPEKTPPTSFPVVQGIPDNGEALTIRLSANCQKYLSSGTKKNQFFNDLKDSISDSAFINPNRIEITNASCGSIMLSIKILPLGLNETGLTANEGYSLLIDGINSNTLTISVPGENFTAAVILPTRPPPPTTTRLPPAPPVTTNWMPILFGIGAGLLALILWLSYTVYKHTKLYEKKQFTEINSNRFKYTSKKMESKKQRQKKLTSFMHSELDDEIMDTTNAANRRKSSSKSNQITPHNDSYGLPLTGVNSGFPTTDLKLALDQSSSESGNEEDDNVDKDSSLKMSSSPPSSYDASECKTNEGFQSEDETLEKI